MTGGLFSSCGGLVLQKPQLSVLIGGSRSCSKPFLASSAQSTEDSLPPHPLGPAHDAGHDISGMRHILGSHAIVDGAHRCSDRSTAMNWNGEGKGYWNGNNPRGAIDRRRLPRTPDTTLECVIPTTPSPRKNPRDIRSCASGFDPMAQTIR